MGLLAGGRPTAFDARAVVLAPGEARRYEPAEWQGALLVVECGELELEWGSAGRLCLGPGAVLWLEGLRLRTLRNPGAEPAVLVVVARR